MVNSTRKQILRQEIRQILKLMSNEDRIYQSNKITNLMLNHPKYISSKSISVYVNMNQEVSTRDIIKNAFELNKAVFIPRYTTSEMDMLRIYSLDDLDSLPLTKWNIRQPSIDDKTREIANNNLDLMIVPGVAFSFDGSRLGHGKGYYDQYLNKMLNKSYTIGLAFRQQILENNCIPMNINDVRLNEILIVKDD